MFIDLTIKSTGQISRWSASEIEAYKASRGDLLIDLEQYLLDGDNVLNADKIQELLFPLFDIDVFISHSHADEDEAIRIALSMKKIGLKAFVDSCVWAHADKLLEKIDNKFCIPDGWSNYSYRLRNRTTTNVHLILNTALQQMIDRSELFIFLGTENAVKIDDYITGENRLSSPWIFSELTFVKNVRQSMRRSIVLSNESVSTASGRRGSHEVEFSFKLPKSKYEIDFHEFVVWLDAGKLALGGSQGEIIALMHLDELYRKLGLDEDQFSVPRCLIE